jgi:hypothetical protein
LDINSGKIRGITIYRFGGDMMASLHYEGNGEAGCSKKKA